MIASVSPSATVTVPVSVSRSSLNLAVPEPGNDSHQSVPGTAKSGVVNFVALAEKATASPPSGAGCDRRTTRSALRSGHDSDTARNTGKPGGADGRVCGLANSAVGSVPATNTPDRA